MLSISFVIQRWGERTKSFQMKINILFYEGRLKSAGGEGGGGQRISYGRINENDVEKKMEEIIGKNNDGRYRIDKFFNNSNFFFDVAKFF